METRSRLQIKLLFCLADLLLIIVGSTVAQPCSTSSCDLCQSCAAEEQNQYLGNQNETAQVFCQTGSGTVTWQRLNLNGDPPVPISMDTPKYGGSGNRLDVFNVDGSDEGQYQCLYTESGTNQQRTDTACLFVPGTAVFASCHSQRCPLEMVTVQAGDELVIDARIIFINSGLCMIPQNTTFLQLFKGDVIADNRLYECRDVEVCPPSMGSFDVAPAASEGGPINRFNFNLTKASAVMEDDGIYRVRVQVFNPRNAFAIVTKTMSISITAAPIESTTTSTVISEPPTMPSESFPTTSTATPTTSPTIPSPPTQGSVAPGTPTQDSITVPVAISVSVLVAVIFIGIVFVSILIYVIRCSKKGSHGKFTIYSQKAQPNSYFRAASVITTETVVVEDTKVMRESVLFEHFEPEDQTKNSETYGV